MEKELKSNIDIDLMDKFPSQYPNKSYFNYVSNQVSLEGFIAVSGMLLPDIIELDGHVFLKENYPSLGGNLSSRFGNDRKTLERYVNLLCLSDFYLLAADEASDDEYWLLKQGEIIRYFWKQRLNELYPEKEFEFELTRDGLFDEDGVCVTFSQK